MSSRLEADAQQAIRDLIASHERIWQLPVELLEPDPHRARKLLQHRALALIQLLRVAIAAVTALLTLSRSAPNYTQKQKGRSAAHAAVRGDASHTPGRSRYSIGADLPG